MKKVSVIIPTYKRSEGLIRAINSVLKQTYRNIEIIVVDDNDENSEYRKENIKKLKEYIESKKIIYLKHKNNKNGAAARNTGIKKCTGEYITFLDDDDYYLNDRIERLVNEMEKNPEYSCCYSKVAFSNNNGIVAIYPALKSGNLKYDILCQNSVFRTGSNLFFRKSAIDKVGLFDEKFIRHQDMEYMVRFFDIGTILAVNELLIVKCIDDNSNVPNYTNMLKTKEIYLNKFKKDIMSFKQQEINNIYYKNYYEMLCIYVDKYKELKNIIEKSKKITFKDKLKYLLKKIKSNIPIINKIIILIKKTKYKKYNYIIQE